MVSGVLGHVLVRGLRHGGGRKTLAHLHATPGGCAVLSQLPLPTVPVQAVGFVRQSEAPEHQLGAVMGRTGLLRWASDAVLSRGAPDY